MVSFITFSASLFFLWNFQVNKHFYCGFFFIGTYHKGVSPNGLILSDHMTLGAVVATILIIDNTAQVNETCVWNVMKRICLFND